MLREPVVISSLVLAVAIGTLVITSDCRAPSARADAKTMRLVTSMIETANQDMERLLERCTAGEALHVAASCALGER